jgi:N-acetylmuramoyl-L-alanine amidase
VTKVRESPNHGARADNKPLDMIILHYTGMATDKAALDWLCVEESGVSCHYFVDETGGITQLVPEQRRAWHAGKSCWKGEDDINSRSIGIEIVNPGHEFGYRDFPPVQIEAVTRLCLDCGERLEILPQNVLAHSDVAPLRKEDPGERFPWHELHLAGVGQWVEADATGSGRFFHLGDRGKPIEALQSMLALYGYHIEISGEYDVMTAACITAFQRHFRQEKVDGVADGATISTLYKLLASLPDNPAGTAS